jgi:hypothetical protein
MRQAAEEPVLFSHAVIVSIPAFMAVMKSLVKY